MGTDKTAGEIIAGIEGLKEGESLIYYIGVTGWMYGKDEYQTEIPTFMHAAHASGLWDFTQKKVGLVSANRFVEQDYNVHVFEYRATRRKIAKPCLFLMGE